MRVQGRISRARGTDKVRAALELKAWHAERSRKNMEERKKLLSENQVKDRLRFTQEDLDTLDEVIRSPGRNALAQMTALKLKAQYTLSQPKAEGGDEPISVTVNTIPYDGSGKMLTQVVVERALQAPQEEADTE
jgi:uncharacterized protein YcbK (DUF882 family)